MLNIIELIHNSGLVHNHLELENILVGLREDAVQKNQLKSENIFENVQFHLVNFGLASKWRETESSDHIEESTLDDFKIGNLIFSSVNQCLGFKSSRRDDCHSLVYLLIYLF